MTELIWEGKYDKDGRKVAPLRIALPFQTVETVNESMQERQRMLDLFSGGRETEWRNRLIWGDKKYVLPSLLPEFAGKVNLIYIDPPFDTGADFSFTTTIPDSDATFVKEPSVIEQKAYRDTWGQGLDSYVKWFYETAVISYELLGEDGSLYVHLDYHVAHYAKAVLDEVFGIEQFRSEIVWKRKTGRGQTNKIPTEYGTQTDSIFFYTKSQQNYFANPIKPLRQEYIEQFYRHYDPDGRRYRLADLSSPSPRANLMYEYKGYKPPEKGWAISRDKMKEWDAQGRLYFPKDINGRIQRKRYLDENEGEVVQNLWDDISMVGPQSLERIDYPTQKPEALLERIIKASSDEGDLVLDCFSGSGTTAAVAEKLGRRWITCDLGRFAIHTTRKRLLSIPDVKPFVVQNLGKYERQAWQSAEFGEQAAERMQAYRCFILDLYRARPLSGYTWLHGIKNGRIVYIGSVDAPVSMGDVTNIAAEFRRAVGSGEDAPTTNGVDVLGWDFAFEVNEAAKQQAALANIAMRFIRIPREVLEKKAVEQGDIQFFELAALSVDAQTSGKSVTLRLTDFIIPTDDVPEDVQRAIQHWEQWIDYWAVDWDNKGDTFHNEWQAYRTRKEKALQKQVAHTYAESGTYRVVVKVIDILGNDTTKTLSVTVG